MFLPDFAGFLSNRQSLSPFKVEFLFSVFSVELDSHNRGPGLNINICVSFS